MLKQITKRERPDPAMVIAMRESGASLEQIAEAIGRTKERVRQILVKNTGTTRHGFLSTQQLYQLAGISRNQIIELYRDGIIKPAAEWTSGTHHYILWDSDVVSKIDDYYNKKRVCKICGKTLAKGRWVYCSDQCYKEGQKYKYKSAEAKRKHLKNIKEYLERRKGALSPVNLSGKISY